MSTDRVFVYRIGELGDALVALPAIHGIAARHPGARFTLITNPPIDPSHVDAWKVLQHAGVFEGVLHLGADPLAAMRAAVELRRHGRAILYYLPGWRTRYQLVRDTLMFRGLSGISQIHGLARAPAYTGPPRAPDGSLLRLQRAAETLLRAAGLQPDDVPAGPLLAPPEAARDKVAHLLQPLGQRRLLSLGPGSKMPAKRWFKDRFVAVAKRAGERWPDLGFAVLGGPEDALLGDEIVAALPSGRAVNLAGQTNIIESAAALAHCAAYVGNDTGTMHLAASMRVPCVAVFTSRDSPGEWEPWGAGHTILRRDLPCSGCMLKVCERQRMRCLDLITVDQVFDALADTLQ